MDGLRYKRIRKVGEINRVNKMNRIKEISSMTKSIIKSMIKSKGSMKGVIASGMAPKRLFRQKGCPIGYSLSPPPLSRGVSGVCYPRVQKPF